MSDPTVLPSAPIAEQKVDKTSKQALWRILSAAGIAVGAAAWEVGKVYLPEIAHALTPFLPSYVAAGLALLQVVLLGSGALKHNKSVEGAKELPPASPYYSK